MISPYNKADSAPYRQSTHPSYFIETIRECLYPGLFSRIIRHLVDMDDLFVELSHTSGNTPCNPI